MALYKVVPKRSVEKDLRSLPKSTIVRVLKQFDGLSVDPFPRQSVKLEEARVFIGFVLGTIALFMESTPLQSR